VKPSFNEILNQNLLRKIEDKIKYIENEFDGQNDLNFAHFYFKELDICNFAYLIDDWIRTKSCPFKCNNDNSFYINLATGLFICTGCFKRGSAIKFYMTFYEYDYETALNQLIEDYDFKRPLNKPLNIYPYKDQNDKLISQVLRYPNKKIKQRRPDGKDGREWDLNGVERVLYRLPEVIKAKTVYIVELQG